MIGVRSFLAVAFARSDGRTDYLILILLGKKIIFDLGLCFETCD